MLASRMYVLCATPCNAEDTLVRQSPNRLASAQDVLMVVPEITAVAPYAIRRFVLPLGIAQMLMQ